METPQRRDIAYKLWISQLLSSNFVKKENDSRAFLQVDKLNVSRINLIANAVLKNDYGSYSSLLIDDGSGSIRVKAWQQDVSLLADVNVGDILLITGRIREYNDERYILPEIVKKLESHYWLMLRKLELTILYPEEPDLKPKVQKEVTFEEIAVREIKVSPSLRHKLISTIENSHYENGIALEEISSLSNLSKQEISVAISELVKEGEIYEHKPGRYKLLE